jgi:hypothetical protein
MSRGRKRASFTLAESCKHRVSPRAFVHRDNADIVVEPEESEWFRMIAECMRKRDWQSPSWRSEAADRVTEFNLAWGGDGPRWEDGPMPVRFVPRDVPLLRRIAEELRVESEAYEQSPIRMTWHIPASEVMVALAERVQQAFAAR